MTNFTHECSCYANESVRDLHSEISDWEGLNKTACVVGLSKFILCII